jgi:hypothetical protein
LIIFIFHNLAFSNELGKAQELDLNFSYHFDAMDVWPCSFAPEIKKDGKSRREICRVKPVRQLT